MKAREEGKKVMTIHTMWKGTISFGLVNIPIKLHAATENKDVRLRQLHKECKTPINYLKVCPNCDAEVEPNDIVKAYEYAKNKFVELDEEELASLKKEQEDKAVEIIDFVKLQEIDPIYFDKSYYMSPGDGGGKAYTLLREALAESEKIGVAKIIIRAKEHLAVIRVYKNTLLMETIHFPDEVRAVDQVPNVPEKVDVTKKEVDTALLLIDQLTTTFDPDKYEDDYRQALMEMIENKKAGKQTVTAKEKEPAASNVTDLMEALQASIDKTKKAGAKKTTRKRTNAKTKKNA